jgi:hypothetical protein
MLAVMALAMGGLADAMAQQIPEDVQARKAKGIPDAPPRREKTRAEYELESREQLNKHLAKIAAEDQAIRDGYRAERAARKAALRAKGHGV